MSESQSTDDEVEFEEYEDIEDVEIDMLLRKSIDEITEANNSYSFDPLGQQISSGTVYDHEVSVEVNQLRDESSADVVVDFDGEDKPEVVIPTNDLILAAFDIAVEEGYFPDPEEEEDD